MEMWDGFFEMPGQPPARMPSSHVPVRTITTSKRYEIELVEPIAAPAIPTPATYTPRRAEARRAAKRRDTTTTVTITASALAVNAVLLSIAIPWITGVPLPNTASRVLSVLTSAFAVVAMFAFMRMTIASGLRTETGSDSKTSEEGRTLSDVCQDIRGAHRHYRPNGGDLHTALVEATHRCCRLVNIAKETTDSEVVETIALVQGRLPALLDAYERTKALADPSEAWVAVDRMAEAVIMIGDQAEAARKRLLAAATDGLETEVRYLSARTGRDRDGLSSILAPVG